MGEVLSIPANNMMPHGGISVLYGDDAKHKAPAPRGYDTFRVCRSGKYVCVATCSKGNLPILKLNKDTGEWERVV